jgi:cytochrome c oxidase subunit 2
MKKLIIVLGALALMLALAACGAKPDAPAASSNGAAAAADSNAQQIKIVATNWQFDQPEYHVKKGQPVTITFESKQGLHSASINDFKVKLDNNTKTTTFTPDKSGTHEIRCMTPCGQGHANMTAKLIVD